MSDRRASETPGKPAAVRVGRSYRTGTSGALYLFTTIFLGIGAINAQNNLLFFAFGLAIAGLVVSGVISGSGLMGLRIERLDPPPGEVGSPGVIRYRVSNANRLVPLICVWVEEKSFKRSGDQKACARPSPAYVELLAPGASTIVESFVSPTRRGVVELNEFRGRSGFPFGLVTKIVRFRQRSDWIVRPARVELTRAAAERVVPRGPRGADVSSGRGDGQEFYGLREYAEGDSIREIAWKPSARAGSLLVMQRTSPRAAKVRVRFEFSGADAEAFELGLAMTASVLRTCQDHGVQTSLVGDDSKRGIEGQLDALAKAVHEPGSSTGPARIVIEPGTGAGGRGVELRLAESPRWLTGGTPEPQTLERDPA